MMPDAIKTRIDYYYEAFRISEEQSRGKAWLERHKGYKPVVREK